MIVLVFFPFIKLHYGKQLFFSKDPGYYDSEFYLTILGGGKNEIHYTLDGNKPTTNDPVFDRNHPLHIDDATGHPNIYSTRTDTSTAFLTDLIKQYAQDAPIYAVPTYTVPVYALDKCTVIRASLFDSAGNCLDSITGSYFVGFREKKAYQNIYIASVVTSPENLFDSDIGIYVTGNTNRQFWDKNLGKEVGVWWSWDSNYISRGIEWERDAHITIFDNHHNSVLSQKCGIRIKGNATRALLPKSVSCYAREKYNGNNDFNTDIFKTGIFPHKIVLFSGGNDNVFKLKDYLVNVMEKDLNFATMDFIPCALFLDGEYWGMYYITEDYNADYIHDHYQVARDNIIRIKNGILDEGNDTDYKRYEEMLSFIGECDMSNTENYNRTCDMIDIDSFIDYYAAQIYIARCADWPYSNFALWRTRDNDGSRYGDNKWRWMLFDVNYGGLDCNYLFMDNLAYTIEEEPIFASLYQNEEFRRKFAKRLLYIGKEVFAPEKCNQFLDQYIHTLKEPISASNKRFYMDEKSEEFELYVADMRTFFNERYDVVWDFLAENMGEEWLAQNGIQK